MPKTIAIASVGTSAITSLMQQAIAAVPGVVCASHGPFAWGKDPAQAVYHAVVLEEVAKMAILTRQVRASAGPAPQRYQDKHYFRKHGPGAYYGQG